MDTSTASHYNEIEIQDLIENLEDADIARSLQVYRTLGCDARSGLSAHDVLGQVIVKALSLERKWPRDLNAISFFVETGKSIISNEEDKHSKLTITASVDKLIAVNDESLKPTSATAKFTHESTEVGIENSQSEDTIATWIKKIQRLFKDDAQADCFIKQKIQEHKKSKILDLCNFTDQVYRNVEKRVKDKVRKRFPNGLPWWEVKS
ncbi:MAG: hypothetical protein AB2821_14980 [Candidatus Thiodiazotropha endolucinida]